LKDEEEFERVSGHPAGWTLTGGPTTPSIVPDTSLAAAVVNTQVTVPAWNSQRRDAPLADRGSFIRMLRAVLTAADGSLTASDIARAVATRLDYRRTPLSIELDVLEGIAERSPRQNPAAQASSAVRAAQVFDELDDRDRILIALYEQPVRGLGDTLALRRSQAALLRQRLARRLRDELADDTEPDETISVLRRLCECWLENRTSPPSATSPYSIGTEEGIEGKGGR
jgi:hypothetical protein